jgi:CheY-like chemotaxis protein
MTPERDPAVKILVVEDNPMLAELRADLFKELGCEVTTAPSAEEAVAELSAVGPVDVVMTDVNLSSDEHDQSGLALARWVSESHPEIPVVAYTAHFQEADLAIDKHPEISQWFVKGSLRLPDLEKAMEDVVQLGRRARIAREK